MGIVVATCGVIVVIAFTAVVVVCAVVLIHNIWRVRK